MKRSFAQSLALYATVIFTLVMILFPVYWLLVTALSTTDELYRLPPTFWPDDPQWDIFARVWAAKPILLWLWNSMLAAVGSVALSMLVSASAGYALSRYSMRGGATMECSFSQPRCCPPRYSSSRRFRSFRASV